MSKRIMREFTMNEISTVDNPAQKNAKMTIMKRDNIEKNNKETQMSDELNKKVTDLTAEVEKAKADLAKAEKLAGLSDAEKDAMAKMADGDKDKWLAMTSDERKSKLSETKKNDETVEIAGQSISKSEVGPAVFAVMKSQAEEIRKSNERIAKAEKEAAFAKFEKRASEELKNLPGTDVEKAELLEAVAGLSEPLTKRFGEVLKAANDALDGAFKNVGKRSEKTVEKKDQLEKAVADIMAANPKLTKSAAMERAVSLNPELVGE